MSNTSSLSSYAGAATTVPATSAASAAAARGLGDAIRWLCADSVADRRVREGLEDDARSRRLTAARAASAAAPVAVQAPTVTSVPLKLAGTESLCASAAKLGYRAAPLRGDLGSLAEKGTVLLHNGAGERLVVTRNPQGLVEVQALGARPSVERRVGEVLRQHSVDRVQASLAAQGMTVQAVSLPNGEAQLVGREQGVSRRDGNAVVRLQVRTNGEVDLDVDCIRGRRCEEIRDRLARDIGAEVRAVTRKPAFHEEPGERARIRIEG